MLTCDVCLRDPVHCPEDRTFWLSVRSAGYATAHTICESWRKQKKVSYGSFYHASALPGPYQYVLHGVHLFLFHHLIVSWSNTRYFTKFESNFAEFREITKSTLVGGYTQVIEEPYYCQEIKDICKLQPLASKNQFAAFII